MNILTLDSNNRVTGYRKGSYHLSDDLASHEVVIELDLQDSHLHALYDVNTSTFTYDEVYQANNPVAQEVSPELPEPKLNLNDLQSAVRNILNAQAVTMGYSDIDAGVAANKNLETWRKSVWNNISTTVITDDTTIEGLISLIPSFASVTANT